MRCVLPRLALPHGTTGHVPPPTGMRTGPLSCTSTGAQRLGTGPAQTHRPTRGARPKSARCEAPPPRTSDRTPTVRLRVRATSTACANTGAHELNVRVAPNHHRRPGVPPSSARCRVPLPRSLYGAPSERHASCKAACGAARTRTPRSDRAVQACHPACDGTSPPVPNVWLPACSRPPPMACRRVPRGAASGCKGCGRRRPRTRHLRRHAGELWWRAPDRGRRRRCSAGARRHGRRRRATRPRHWPV